MLFSKYEMLAHLMPVATTEKYFGFIVLILLFILLWWLSFPNTCLYIHDCKNIYLYGILSMMLFRLVWLVSIIYIYFAFAIFALTGGH